MRIELKETYVGEFDAPSSELAEKLSKGVEELAYAFNKSNALESPDGSLHVLNELSDLLATSFLKRTKRLENVILDTLRNGSPDAD